MKPTIDPRWATNLITEDKVIDGIVQSVPNKIPLKSGIEDTGVVFDEYVDRQQLNQILDVLSQWANYTSTLYKTGAVYMTESGETAAAISTQLGGTWVERGTITDSLANVYVSFVKVA